MRKSPLIIMTLILLAICFVQESYAVGFKDHNTLKNSFAGDIYRIAIEDILQGPIGFVSGAAAIVIGAVSAITGRIIMAVPAILGGAALLKADAIVRSLGLLF